MRASLKSSLAKSTSPLISRNVLLNTHRTSMRLSPEFWSAAEDICHREDCTLAELVERAGKRAGKRRLTNDLRSYILSYYRDAATEMGHAAADHGERDKVVS